MSLNIAEFRTVISDRDLQRPNKFAVDVPLPLGMYGTEEIGSKLQTARDIRYWAEGSDFPAFGVQTYQNQRYGYGTQSSYPSGAFFAPIQMTLIFDQPGNNLQLMHDWQRICFNIDKRGSIIDPTNRVNAEGQGSVVNQYPYEIGYRNEYAVNLTLKLYSPLGVVTKSATLREAFPSQLGPVQFNWNDNNTYCRLPVTFSFTDFYYNPIQSIEEN